jgi:hypothetical protein
MTAYHTISVSKDEHQHGQDTLWWEEPFPIWLLMTSLSYLDLSRICAAPSARLGHFPFEGDRAFPAQC